MSLHLSTISRYIDSVRKSLELTSAAIVYGCDQELAQHGIDCALQYVRFASEEVTTALGREQEEFQRLQTEYRAALAKEFAAAKLEADEEVAA